MLLKLKGFSLTMHKFQFTKHLPPSVKEAEIKLILSFYNLNRNIFKVLKVFKLFIYIGNLYTFYFSFLFVLLSVLRLVHRVTFRLTHLNQVGGAVIVGGQERYVPDLT